MTTISDLAGTRRDYSLTGRDAALALDKGLVSAQWYHTPIPRQRMKEFMQRKDGPAIRDTLVWILAFLVTGGLAVYFYPGWWSVPFFLAYGVLYGSSTDSRWHECGHRTAFKTVWMNDVVYQLACFMIMREPEVWRWSHTRHHTDTIIVGRDPEIAIMRPTDVPKVIGMLVGIPQVIAAVKKMVVHAAGRLDAQEATYIPPSEAGKVFATARIWIAIHVAVVALAVYLGSWLPMLLAGPLPTMYGAWVHILTGVTQHSGLPEDVLDHRLNCRTVYMNPLLRFIYWNMNYHIEHHMFPMVPYHALPALHQEMLADTPPPYRSMFAAYAEIIPTIWRQRRDIGYTVLRPIPTPGKPAAAA